jgi:hypothetical protein
MSNKAIQKTPEQRRPAGERPASGTPDGRFKVKPAANEARSVQRDGFSTA